MGREGGREQHPLPMGAYFKVVGITLLLLLCYPAGSLLGVNSLYMEYFDSSDINGMKSLWAAWNTSTQHPESNLLNWATSEGPIYPCYNGIANWRGVTCLRWQLNATQSNTWMVGLQLSDAFIGGSLPPEIKNFAHLTTLSLTGNPNLTGPLPKELAQVPLNILDLHDNGFNGTIPLELSSVKVPEEPTPGNLLNLDLSGNQFTGEFPVQFMQTSTLQVFRIARNQLLGTISPNAFENLTQLLIADVSGNNFTGQPPIFGNLTKLNNLNLSYNRFTGLPDLSEIFSTGWLPKDKLGVLDLSGLNFGGQLPDWKSSQDLLSVSELYLNNINVSGVLDMVSMQSSTNLTIRASNTTSRTLQVLSLMDNNIVNVIFDKPSLLDRKIKLFLQGNPYCNDSSKDADGRKCFCEGYCVISDSSPKSYWKVIVITTSVCGFVLGSVILGLVITLHRKNRHVHALLKRFEDSEVSAKRFEYSVLRAATKNFAEERKLGQGAYGAVFKGILNNNVEIAVKQLFMKTKQASEDFLNEVLLITNLQHRNLVALKGYCLHGKEMLLVYEYVDFCDLEKLLFKGANGPNGPYSWQVVGWAARMNICLGVAQGLYYLHASSQTRIIHRDIKASNILLDKSLNPKIADFGLARPIEENEIMTQQRAGTLGYLAPEYMLFGQLSEKADVYSFGVLILEIVSGSRNKDPTQAEDDIYLPTRAWKLHREDKLMEVLDPRLHVSKDEALEVRRVLETALLCVQTSPEKRPTMFRVVAMVAGDATIEPVVADTSNIWPEFIPPYRTGSGDPLLRPSSTSRGSSGLVPKASTSGSVSIEFSDRSTR